MIHPFSFFDLMKIVLVLIGLRMYDDVMQSEDESLDKLKLPLLIFFKKNMRFWWLLIILILRVIALNFGG